MAVASQLVGRSSQLLQHAAGRFTSKGKLIYHYNWLESCPAGKRGRMSESEGVD